MSVRWSKSHFKFKIKSTHRFDKLNRQLIEFKLLNIKSSELK